MENFKEKVVSGFAWEASARLIVTVTSWVSTIWVARLLSQEDYGVVGVSGIFTGLCLQLAGMGLGSALVNKQDLKDRDLSNVFWVSLILSISLYFFLFLVAPLIASFYELSELKKVIRVAGLMVVISCLSMIPRSMMMRQLKFRVTALVNMASSLIVIAMTLYLAYSGWGYWSLILSTIIGEVFLLIVYVVIVRYRPGRIENLSTLQPLLIYGGKVLSASLVAFASSQLAVVFASTILGIAAAGSYQMAKMLASLPMSKIGELFQKIGFPAFSRIQDDIPRTRSVFLRVHRILFMLTAPMFVGIALTADLIIPLVLGEKWASIVVPIRILCVLNIFMISAQLIPRVLDGIGNSTAGLVYQIILLIVGSISMGVGIQWGLNWMLIGWAATFPLGYIYLLRVMFRQLNMTLFEFWQSIQVTLVCTAIMTATIIGLQYLLNYYDLFNSTGGSLSREVTLEELKGASNFLQQLTFLILKVAVGALAFYLSYFLIAKEHLKELTGLVRK